MAGLREKSLQHCKDLAFNLLGRRAHSRWELQQKLERRERYEADVIAETVSRMLELVRHALRHITRAALHLRLILGVLINMHHAGVS